MVICVQCEEYQQMNTKQQAKDSKENARRDREKT
jgi:hypothetical protein